MKKRKRRIKPIFKTTAEDVIRTWNDLRDAARDAENNDGDRDFEKQLRNYARAYTLVVDRIEGRS